MPATNMHALFAAAVVCLLGSVTSSESPVVTLKYGSLRGHSILRNNRSIFAFEGIPYARPPVGDRRFKDPEEVAAWSAERDASAPGARCLQYDLLLKTVHGEEDCLFLNVYTDKAPEEWENTKQPVLVWIHGGAFIMGTGNMDRMKPDPLLEKGFVFVSLNYRLAVLGFLNTEDSGAPGNAGLKDTVLALRWVKENIAAFGGDPEQVSVFGLSAGAAIVHYLTLSPLASGLFSRAAALSGTAFNPWAFAEERRVRAQRFGARVGCNASQELVPCLQGKDARELLQALQNQKSHLFWKKEFLPSVEAPESSTTPLISSSPRDLAKDTSAKTVPFLTGIVDTEGTIFYLFGGKNLHQPSEWVTVNNTFDDNYIGDLPLGLRTRQNMQRIKQRYLAGREISNVPNDEETRRRFLHMVGDILFGEGVSRAAEAASRRGAPTYMYEFKYDSPAMAVTKRLLYKAPDVAGVAHGDDAPYIFDAGVDPSQADAAVKARHITLLTNFFKTGNPTPEGGSLPPWPQFTPEKQSYAELGETIKYKDNGLSEINGFWRDLESSSRSTTESSSASESISTTSTTITSA